ncbi:MAG TPA: hypothetical protein VEA80_13710 [Vitreimonas sp.]|uniref:hypothetical protein n=1 Tax=Vitreimonas sp. TaxID=3069702 RepID=UPI002D276B28|nr:hypothetical protein [Vitreimonas sp.]HYD88527.1 hypothetical protein [Vitreimonas sp.]
MKMIRTALIACALAGAAFPALAQEQTPAAPAAAPAPQETCGVLSTGAETSSFTPVPGLTLLNATPPLTRPEGDVDGLLCIRSGIYLGPNDHRVLTDLGVPFFIRDAARLATLERTQGQLRLRFVRGAPTAEESQAMVAAIDRAHAEMANRS